MTIKAKTLLRELKSLEGSMTQPWKRRVTQDAIRFVEDTMKGPVEQGWDALARINAAKMQVEPPVAPNPAAEEAKRAMDEVEQAYHHGYAIEYMDPDDPLSGWHDATDTLAKQGFMWDDLEYRVKPQ